MTFFVQLHVITKDYQQLYLTIYYTYNNNYIAGSTFAPCNQFDERELRKRKLLCTSVQIKQWTLPNSSVALAIIKSALIFLLHRNRKLLLQFAENPPPPSF